MEDKWVSTQRSFEGFPYSYNCEREGATAELKTALILFDFEFVITDPGEGMQEVIAQDIPEVEFGILNRLANVTGLDTCDLRHQLNDPWLLDGEVSDPTTMTKENLVLGLTSFRPDTPNPIGKFVVVCYFPLVLTCYSPEHLTSFRYRRFLSIYYEYS